MARNRRHWLAAMLTTALVVAGCSGDDAENSTSTNSPPTTTQAVATTTAVDATPSTSAAPTVTDQVLRIGVQFVPDAPTEPLGFLAQSELALGNSELLLRPSADGPQPWLAESVEQLAPTRWEVTLKPGVTFQNGRALDGDALAEWFDYVLTTDASGQNPVLLGNPVKATVSGPLTVEIETAEPFGRMDYGLAHYHYPVFDAGVVRSVDGDFTQLVDAGIYTGPYHWTSFDPGVVRYERNEQYWQGTPALAGIEARTVGDTQAGLLALSVGEIDMLGSPAAALGPNPDELDNVNTVSTTDVMFIGFALEPRIAPFDDTSVRRAFAAALDTDAIAEAVGPGVARAMNGWFPSDDARNLPWNVYDPAEAERLLDQAGWTREGDGARTKDGRTLHAILYAYTDLIESVAVVASQMLEDVGFDVEIRRFESYTEVQPVQSVEGGAYVVNTENYGLNGDPIGTMAYVMAPAYTTPGYEDVIDVIRPALTDSDPALADEVLADAQQLLRDRAYWIPAVAPGAQFVVADAYAGYQPDPFGLAITWQTAPGE